MTKRTGSRRAVLYLRVSTGSQTTENQRVALEAVAAGRGWEIVHVYEDRGVSGTKGRDKRPGLDAMLKDASRGKFDVVMVWALDRLGRSLPDLLSTAQHLQAIGVDLYIDQQAIDTTTPAGKLFFAVSGAFAEFERNLIRERVVAGLRRAKAKGTKLGRPTFGLDGEIVSLRAAGHSIRTIAAKLRAKGKPVSPSGVAKVLRKAA